MPLWHEKQARLARAGLVDPAQTEQMNRSATKNTNLLHFREWVQKGVEKMFGLFEKKQIASLVAKLPREELLRRSRILIIDDEKPEIIEDLKAAGFAVDYFPDVDSKNMNCLDRPLYDLILLDFGKV